MNEHDVDVLVIGGGPAGSSTATLLARQGRRVALLERERFPRFRIGESFMPATWWTFEKLGLVEALNGSHFTKKYSVQFYTKDARPTRPFYFADAEPHLSSQTWQVDRGEFDSLLLRHARDCGVDVREETSVQQVLFEDGRAVGVRATGSDGTPHTWSARVVVDASGQAALMSSRMSLRKYDPRLKNAAVFTRFEGALRDPGIDGGATLVIHTDNAMSWFWYIPLAGDVVSVGVVGPMSYLITGRSSSPQQIFEEEVARCPALQPRIAGKPQVMEMKVLRDFTYISDRIAGDGWVLVGDAFGFLDPIYSSGVLLALKGAEMASASIEDAFQSGDFSAARLGRHGHDFVAGMEAIRRLVHAFYAPGFHFREFLQRFPECREALTHVLIGNVYRHSVGPLYEKMDQMLDLPGYTPLSLPPIPAEGRSRR
ncbi:MAG: NAD(P)/FAD-dependent oxidoreductase [Candidatus Polarisedimenticolia bacterium]